MSRVGRQPVAIPKGVSVELKGNRLTVKGPKGTLEREFHPDMKVLVQDGLIRVERPSDSRIHKSLHGLTRALIANMVHGVTEGYEKALEMSGVGYRATKSGDKVILNLGFAKPVEIQPPKGIVIDVPSPTSLVIRGADKEAVGELAARIRRLRPPEPYQGSGIKYVGEKIRRKAAKTAK
ncbi:MAG TPA: 50S ribosomal protein L6 [Firmicutes bacterium]|nr:50S ribosomal protein L6 [Candidatus Fermentithermobacillaceae bacterium]